MLIGGVSVAAFITVFIIYLLTPPEYVAEAKLLIEPPRGIKESVINIGGNGVPFYMDTLPWLLRSKPVITLAAKNLGLKEGTKNFDNVCGKMVHDLHVRNLPDSLIFTVYIKSNDPVFAARATNAIVNAYLIFLDEEKQKEFTTITSELKKELNSIKKKIEDAEKKLLHYVQKHSLSGDKFVLPFEGANYTAETSVISELETKYINLEIELFNLLTQYKHKYPLVIQKRNELNAIRKKIDMMKKLMLKANEKHIKYIMLSDDVRLNIDLYNIIIKDLSNLNIFNIGSTAVTVIQYATVPTQPMNRNILHWLLFGSFISVVIGIIVGMLVDQLDNKIKDEKDIEMFIKYPVISVLPFLDDLKTNKYELFSFLNNSLYLNFIEALRLLRINLRYSSIEKSKSVLLITSTGKNEGKTTVSLSLGYILSITGAKVLLIDANVRNPAIHRFFNSELVPGFTELLINEKYNIMDMIKYNSFSKLYYLTSGRQPPNFAELIDSQYCKTLIRTLKNNFDYVIIDSAPISMFSDAAILSNHVDNVLFIVKKRGYSKVDIINAILLLKSINAKIGGVILI